MKITNKYNLAQAIVDAITANLYAPKEESYSATTILKGQTEAILHKRHYDELEIDVSDLSNAALGTAVHELFEKHGKTGFEELYLREEITPGRFFSCKIDVYDAKNRKLIDYKTGSLYKVQKQDFDDFYKQGMEYTWILEKKQMPVEEIEFQILLKDFSPREKRLAKMRGEWYPESQFYTYKFTPTIEDRLFIDKYIKDWFAKAIELEQLPDSLLPYCGDSNTWYNGDSFAVYETKDIDEAGNPKPNSKAKRVLKSYVEAEDWISKKITEYMEKYTKAKTHPEYAIKKRLGEHRKCQDYCSCCEFCEFYKTVIKKELEGGNE